jgi:formylmethanofuran dehydrogenase subunit D
MNRLKLAAAASVLICTVGIAQAQVNIKATNKLQLARANQTIEISGKDLAPLNVRDLANVHVKDSTGKEVLCQAVDTDYDDSHRPDIVIFQADFAPGESKTFTASAGAKQQYSEEQFKAHGRFVRERFDDFAWENDRIAHRTYGKGLETWKDESLISSTIDIWSKRTSKMVIDKWYMLDNYHADGGEGFDDYSAGVSRGDGGNGIWVNNQLQVSKNFVNSRVLANGPIRVCFELDYDSFGGNGIYVTEVKRVTLDAGGNLDHYQSSYKLYKPEAQMSVLTSGVGLKKVQGETAKESSDKGWFAKWERMEKNAGTQGLAVVYDPKSLTKQAEDNQNWLVLLKCDPNNSVSYWAGFCWDKGGQFTDFDGWKKYVDEAAQGAASPIEVTVGQ